MKAKKSIWITVRRKWMFYIMLIPAIVLALIFCYWPMYGVLMAFVDYNPGLGIRRSEYVGLYWFKIMFGTPDVWQVLQNTIIISCGKIVMHTIAQILVSLLLNEIRNLRFKKTIQTLIYLPHFLSWVLLGGILIDLLSTNGMINTCLQAIGLDAIPFLSSDKYFRGTIIATDVWKEFGWGTIIYLAALTGINPELYEAAAIDGGNRLQQAWHISLPGIRPTIALLLVLSLKGVLSAGFDQIFVLYSPIVYKTGDILDTYLYRAGLLNAQFSLATAAGLIKSFIGMILMAVSHGLAYKYANYTIF